MSEQAHAPDGFHTVAPYLITPDPAAAIAFYVTAFGAREIFRQTRDGKVGHAEIVVGDSPIMLAPEFEFGGVVARSPVALNGSSAHVFLYVPDVDALFARALKAGAREVMAVADQPHGDRMGGVVDPFGHVWWLATFDPERGPTEMKTRYSTGL